jgi:penicillin-binding protein 2
MEPKYRFRLYLLTALVLTGCGTLLSRLYEFQIDRRAQFMANTPTTHTVEIYEPGVRGEIVDRNGVVLARNRRSYEIVFNLEDIYKSYKQQQKELLEKEKLKKADPNPNEKDDGNPEKEPTDKEIVRIIREFVVPRLESFGLTGQRFTNGISSHYNTHGGLVPYVYRQDLTPEQFAKIAVRSNEIPGVEVRVMPRRIYPYGSLAGHLLGYVKQWAKGDNPPEELRNKRFVHFEGPAYGVAGVELTTNEFLKGAGGKRVLVRNEKRKVIATDDYQRAQEGAEVQLTIDARIQYIVENVLRKIGRGAAVVMDPNTGEVLAMASVPNFDPNDFIPGITKERFAEYNNNRADPLINRAISPFIPGSTYKLPTAIAGALHERVGYGHSCRGYSAFGVGGNLKIGCWKEGGHGPLGLTEAIQRSCNPYFMSLAGDLGSKVMVDTFSLLGFGRKSGILLPFENEGFVPGSNAWKRKHAGATMTRSNLALLSIGQGESMATPLQICSVAATIANGGRYYQPRIIHRITSASPSGDPVVLKENIPIVKADLIKEGMSEYQLEVIRKGMWKAVNESGGTATTVAMENIFIAAKTGTAQVSKFDQEHTHNAWTTSFAPYDSPRYAVCVMVENGKNGGAVAGVLTHYIYRAIFSQEAGVPQRLTKLGIYKGNFDSYKELERPENGILMLAIDDDGETGNEVDQALLEAGQPIKVKPKTIPLPSIAPTPDRPATE